MESTRCIVLAGVIAASAGGCARFDPGLPGAQSDASFLAIDAASIDAPTPPPALTVVAGTPRSAGCGTDSTADDCDLTIDTTGAGSITLRNGAAWTDAALTSAQQANAPDLALLQLGQVTIQDEARLRVIGDRPLVIQAIGDIVLNGVIYVNAVGLEPGANGGPPGQVPPGRATIAMNCQGKQGAPEGNGGHAGGGGGGFATPGAPGGTVCESPPCCDTDAGPCEDDGAGGVAGASHGSEQLTTLLGGCGGGQGAHDDSGNCDNNQGGAGGGAIRLIAAGSITIGSNGGINVGGGGGRSGVEGDDMDPKVPCNDSSGAGGGGSGGAIHLQATSIDLQGFLAANGGGGGGAGGMTSNFVPGQDGQLSANPASGGRMSMTPDRGAGGNGGAAGAEPVPGDNYYYSNGGGGGGAVGRILLSGQVTPDPPTGRCSPACVTSN